MALKEILGIFILIVLLAGKLIEKSLKSAAKAGVQQREHDTIGPDDDAEADMPETVEAVPSMEEADRRPCQVLQPSVKGMTRGKPAGIEESGKAKSGKLDIDPKKMVIYSEIMNPKF